MTSERETGRALGISINAQVDQGRVIVFQTHVDADIGAEALDAMLDKLNVAADRQAAFYELPQLKKAIRAEEDRLHLMETNFSDMEAKKELMVKANGRRNPREDAQELIAKVNATDQIKRQRQLVAEVESTLSATAAKAGERYGAASSADS